MKIIKKILVPTDFSDLSLAAMEFASTFSIIYDAPISVIHVVDKTPVLGFHTVDLNFETLLRDAEEKATKELNLLITSRFPNLHNVDMVVRHGEAHKEIVKFAEKGKFDLIVIATHGRTGLAHTLMGSVAEKVVRHSSVPVLTVNPLRIEEDLITEEDVKEQLHIP